LRDHNKAAACMHGPRETREFPGFLSFRVTIVPYDLVSEEVMGFLPTLHLVSLCSRPPCLLGLHYAFARFSISSAFGISRRSPLSILKICEPTKIKAQPRPAPFIRNDYRESINWTWYKQHGSDS
jgi:hypothetical protein